jgi:response regulator NasT
MRHSPCVIALHAKHRRAHVNILLADDDAERAGAIARILAADAGLTVLRLKSNESLADGVAALAPDVVLVDMARPDRDALDGIRQLTALIPRPVVLFVDEDDAGFMEEAISAGVCSYNSVGMPPPDVKPILRAAVALFRRHQQSRDDLKEAESRLQERAIIDKAKAILIKQRRLNEPNAYRWLRRTAMSSARRIVDVANEVIKDLEGSAE